MTYLGHIARNSVKLPHNYPSWSDIPDNILDGIWEDIKADTTVPSAYRINCIKSLGKKWREWKSSIKREFLCGRSKEEASCCCPKRVEPDQQERLLELISVEQLLQSLERRQTSIKEGEETYILSVYVGTRIDTNGVPVNEEATNVIDSMKERLKEFPPEE
ncbi:hypothetical protein M9H77_18936 [Catharanthus roseus]|uniref:Uncharacterized protein n=1 Tax=Catharanthus roseus TaxID=4058 RepID=A0ACC0B945_CATRO|nr:hypothetical protein M9H77_18936 [Catharanthus roseus]